MDGRECEETPPDAWFSCKVPKSNHIKLTRDGAKSYPMEKDEKVLFRMKKTLMHTSLDELVKTVVKCGFLVV